MLRKASVVFEMPNLEVAGEALSRAEIDFFLEHGFVVKRGLIASDALDAALDRVWSYLLDRVPVARGSAWSLSREDRTTWLDPQWAPMPPPAKSGLYQGRQRIVYSGAAVKLHDLGDADYLLDLVPNNPDVRCVAEALLGDDLRPSQRTRGVYAVFPTTPLPTTSPPAAPPSGVSGAALGPHTDQVCQQLNACAYLDDVAPRNGGFTVYPGSHRILFQAHRTEANWSPLPTYRDAMRQVVANIEPVELVGDKGTVIFWHGRTVHSAGIHLGSDIRWAVFADFMRKGDVLTAEEHKHAGQFEWFKDAKLLRHDPAVSDDMWRGWKVGS